MDSDKINLLKRIVKKQDDLIGSFTDWVRLVKTNNLEDAAKTVEVSKVLRDELKVLKQEFNKINKKSGIIKLNN